MRYNTLGEMFFGQVERLQQRTAYMYKEAGSYKSISFLEAGEQAKGIAAGLISLGVTQQGEKVALLSENRLEWSLSDYAILSLGAVSVPIYPSLLSHQVEYILKDSEAVVVICSTKEQYEKAVNAQKNCPKLKALVLMDGDGENSFENMIKTGQPVLEKDNDFLKKKMDQLNSDDLATIIYTSGTTGEPKGAMLTHGNFISNIEGGLEYLTVDENDTFLSFLPLCHIFERMAGHFLAMYCGATVAFAESIDTVADNMGEVKPTVMASVPRLYEKIYARILENVESGPPLKRKIFYWALGVGRDYVNKIMDKQPIGAGLKAKRGLAYKLVFSKLAQRVGGRLRFFVSGGAPLAKEIGEFFAAAGLMIYEGYGLTETSPVISVNSSQNFRFGTVGLILKNVEVKIADDGEILTRGPHIMLGYFKKEEETKEAIDSEGWFHTGDIGFIDDNGLLSITDRKKNILVTSGGKNIAPQPIENQLVTLKYIEQAMVIGDKRKFCSAVIVPAFEAIEKWAEANNVEYSDPKEFAHMPAVREMIEVDIETVNNNMASFETIKDFILTEKPFSIETGELTPSLKVKRKVVLEKFKDQIEQMYQV
jgi:long-chain acyl-CoA synthetase